MGHSVKQKESTGFCGRFFIYTPSADLLFYIQNTMAVAAKALTGTGK
jgi:hypothetical protein